MLNKIKVFWEISKITKLANELASQTSTSKRWGFLLTNRSFLVPALGILLNILILLNFPLLAPVLNILQSMDHAMLTEQIVLAITALTFVWSFLERMWLRWKGIDAKVVLTRTDAENAVTKVVGDDKLAQALIAAKL